MQLFDHNDHKFYFESEEAKKLRRFRFCHSRHGRFPATFWFLEVVATAAILFSSASADIGDPTPSPASNACVVSAEAGVNDIKSCGPTAEKDQVSFNLFTDDATDVGGNGAGNEASRTRAAAHDNHAVTSTYSIDGLFESYFGCSEIIYGYIDRTSVDMARLRRQWTHFRQKYQREVGPLFFSRGDEDDGGIPQLGMAVTTHVADAGPAKGNGVFASRLIRRGALIHSIQKGNAGAFGTGKSWREFVVSLGDEELPPDDESNDGGGKSGGVSGREMACNVIEWSWVQYLPAAVVDNDRTKEDDRDGDNGRDDGDDDATHDILRPMIFLEFDESVLMNNAEWDDEEEANVRCGSPPALWLQPGGEGNEENVEEQEDWGPCLFNYHAVRDIAAGEELLVDYSTFEAASQEGWTDMGL